MWKNLLFDERGQGMTEYGLILGIISIAVIASIASLRTEIINMMEHVKGIIS